MPRHRRDGAPAHAPRKCKLNNLFVKRLKPEPHAFLVWDTHQRGLAVQVQPTGQKSWKTIYRFHGRPRWYHVGDVAAISIADARKLTSRVMFGVAEGKDPCADKRAERGRGTFEEMATRYLEQHAKKRNKSWAQADALVRRHLVPKWGKLQATDISRADVKGMMTRIAAPVVANQTLAAASAIFAWAIREGVVTVNPCQLVERNPTQSRERVLSDTELPQFWAAFDDAGLLVGTALKTILLTGQRPGEVSHMRREHIVDGWWTLPGAPQPDLGWPGTKNAATHRVWLPEAVCTLLAELDGDGFVFAGARAGTIDEALAPAMRAACKKLGVERATPHDLRRTHGTSVTRLGFGRDAMNRIQNHRDGGIASVYDRHSYADEIKRVMEAAATHIMALAEGAQPVGNVVAAKFGR